MYHSSMRFAVYIGNEKTEEQCFEMSPLINAKCLSLLKIVLNHVYIMSMAVLPWHMYMIVYCINVVLKTNVSLSTDHQHLAYMSIYLNKKKSKYS